MRLRLDLGYDGTDFHGWARQPELRTVQATLEDALSLVLRTSSTDVTCAGRTDAGVHARGQVVHVDVREQDVIAAAGRSTSPRLEALLRRLNGVLPEDVRLHRCREMPRAFDARFCALWRRYAYRIADDPEAVDPLARQNVLAWPRRLDLDAMNQAATGLLGEHDFAAFCKQREGATTTRTMLELRWTRDASGLAVATVRADAFCHNMVRALVGCLLAIGEGRRSPEWAGELLLLHARDSAVTVVPPHALTFEEVGYPPDAALAERARLTRAMRTPLLEQRGVGSE